MRYDRHLGFWLAALALVVVLVAVLGDILLPFVTGAALAYFLDPVADRLDRFGLGRTAAAVVIVGLAAVAMLLAVVFLLPLAVGQLSQLAATLPTDLERFKAALEAWAEQRLGGRADGFKVGLERAFSDLAQGTAGMLAGLARTLVSGGLALVNLVSLLLVTPIVLFYLLRDWQPTLARIDSWLPRDHAPAVRTIATGIDRSVGAFVRGQGTICLILGLFYAVALSLAGLRYGLLIGIATGILSFVPFVGWALGIATASLVALTQAWPETGLVLLVVGIYAAGMAVDAAVLSPLIVGQRIGLHPVWLILALFVFSALFGFVGTLVAVPVAAALAVVVRFARDRYLESAIYLGKAPDVAAPRGPET